MSLFQIFFQVDLCREKIFKYLSPCDVNNFCLAIKDDSLSLAKSRQMSTFNSIIAINCARQPPLVRLQNHDLFCVTWNTGSYHSKPKKLNCYLVTIIS